MRIPSNHPGTETGGIITVTTGLTGKNIPDRRIRLL